MPPKARLADIMRSMAAAKKAAAAKKKASAARKKASAAMTTRRKAVVPKVPRVARPSGGGACNCGA